MNFRAVCLIVALVVWNSAPTRALGNEIDRLMDLWDYADPKATELIFMSLMDEAKNSENKEYLPILVTQLARTHSLRDEFELANTQLDRASSIIKDRSSRAWVFQLLERGRVFNSTGSKARALEYFEEAFRISEKIPDDFLAIDAAHMMAIAESLDKQMKWNVIAMGIAETTKSTRARNWLGSLYNNMGWTLFDQGRFQEALELFYKGVDFRREQGNARRLHIAKWAVARCLRALGNYEGALEIQLDLMAKTESSGKPVDGFVIEELAEIYLVKKEPLAADYFARAYRLLSEDSWLVEHESERLARLKSLASPKESR